MLECKSSGAGSKEKTQKYLDQFTLSSNTETLCDTARSLVSQPCHTSHFSAEQKTCGEDFYTCGHIDDQKYAEQVARALQDGIISHIGNPNFKKTLNSKQVVASCEILRVLTFASFDWDADYRQKCKRISQKILDQLTVITDDVICNADRVKILKFLSHVRDKPAQLLHV